jgi:hypothetical protein
MNHLIFSINQSLQTQNYYAALGMALSLPDICGWVENPTIGSKARYVAWFEKYIQSLYTKPVIGDGPAFVFLTGSDCYALRCAYLHEGRDDINDQRAKQALDSFQFVVPPPSWTVHKNKLGNTLQLQLDIFCQELINGASQFLSDILLNTDAALRLTTMLMIRDVNGKPLIY